MTSREQDALIAHESCRMVQERLAGTLDVAGIYRRCEALADQHPEMAQYWLGYARHFWQENTDDAPV